MISSKSPRKVAMVALAAGKEAFSDYSHVYSPHKFTQPQLFACLVLKEFERKDYRGVTQFLLDCADLREAIGLRSVPHYTTLQKASVRLLRVDRVRRALADTVRRVFGRRRRNVAYAAGDSSGFEARVTPAATTSTAATTRRRTRIARKHGSFTNASAS